MEIFDRHPAAHLIVVGARNCVGVRFRMQGRGIGGLDCLGVVIAAAANANIQVAAPMDYCLRGGSIAATYKQLKDAGFYRLVWGQPGDVLLAAPATRQVHFAIRTELGVVEAHMGMQRVIERPLEADDGWDSAWRMPSG